MIHMSSQVQITNEDIIKIYYSKFSNVVHYLARHSHKCAWCIRKSKGHYHALGWPLPYRSFTHLPNRFLFYDLFFIFHFWEDLAPESISNMSPSWGLGTDIFMVILFDCLLHVPFFLGASRTGTAHNLVLSLMYPSSSNSVTCHFNFQLIMFFRAHPISCLIG